MFQREYKDDLRTATRAVQQAIESGETNLNWMNNNYEDIVSDRTLMESLIIALSETWLDQKTILNINGYKAHFNSIGPGKGLALYLKDDDYARIVLF